MQIILMDKVVNLGGLGDVVKVKDGYARNFLIPTRQARRATEKAIAELEHGFKFNDAILRHLSIRMKRAVTTPSPMMKEEKARSLTSASGEEAKAVEQQPAA